MGGSIKKLWTNPNPTTAFSTQTVSIDLSGYDAVLIDGVYATNYSSQAHSGTDRANCFYIEKNQSYDACYGWTMSGGVLWVTHRTTNVTANGVVFGAGYYYQNASNAQSNTVAIPVRIYGIKKALAN